MFTFVLSGVNSERWFVSSAFMHGLIQGGLLRNWDEYVSHRHVVRRCNGKGYVLLSCQEVAISLHRGVSMLNSLLGRMAVQAIGVFKTLLQLWILFML